MTANEIQQLIEAGLPGAQVSVRGDDGQHFEAEVVWSGFEGLGVVQQHQQVYLSLIHI